MSLDARDETAADTVPRVLEPGRNCMAIAQADRLSVIVDADDYFRFARRAMTGAKRRIMLIGWDFDGRIALGHDLGEEGPPKLGDFVLWLVERNPELEIFLLRWDVGAMKTLVRGSTIITLLKWMAHPRIHTKLDGAHPTGSSHHQKIVVIDDALAFCGGIDMTADRWDTREHAFEDERRRRPFTRRRYKPWHDASTAVTGPAAAALGEISRHRWLMAGGAPRPSRCRASRRRGRKVFGQISARSTSRSRVRRPPIAAAIPSARSRSSTSTRSAPPGDTSMPRASTSPRAASPRRSRTGWRSRTGRRS